MIAGDFSQFGAARQHHERFVALESGDDRAHANVGDDDIAGGEVAAKVGRADEMPIVDMLGTQIAFANLCEHLCMPVCASPCIHGMDQAVERQHRAHGEENSHSTLPM